MSAFWGNNLFLPFTPSVGIPSHGFGTDEHPLFMAFVSQAEAACLEQLHERWGLAGAGRVGQLSPRSVIVNLCGAGPVPPLTVLSDAMGTSEWQGPRITEARWWSPSLQHPQEWSFILCCVPPGMGRSVPPGAAYSCD